MAAEPAGQGNVRGVRCRGYFHSQWVIQGSEASMPRRRIDASRQKSLRKLCSRSHGMKPPSSGDEPSLLEYEDYVPSPLLGFKGLAFGALNS